MTFEVIIGLELHVEMKTKSKLFSSSPVSFGNTPNSQVALFDMAYPGTMPVINKQAVINAIRVCNALHMDIDHELWFDRKNYFYSDLPKGYQITQEMRPIGKNGFIDIEVDGTTKRINIERLHIEEDTSKQFHTDKNTYLDFNRAGIPLVEIVSKPEIKNSEEAVKYVDKIRSIVTFLDVSDGKMEEGSLRCDINISLKKDNEERFGTKVEIKNVNTLANIKRAIDFEIDRQKTLLNNQQNIIQETRRFDEKSKKTVSMRLKIDAIDYKPFVESNIIPITLSDNFIDTAIKTSPELRDERLNRYLNLGLRENNALTILENKENSDYYDELIRLGADPIIAMNWLNRDVRNILKKESISINDFFIRPKDLKQLISLIKENKISNKVAKEVFTLSLKNKETINDIINKMNNSSIDEPEVIKQIVDQVLINNPNLIIDYQNGKDKIRGYIIGQVMKETNGKADPKLTNQIVSESLQRR